MKQECSMQKLWDMNHILQYALSVCAVCNITQFNEIFSTSKGLSTNVPPNSSYDKLGAFGATEGPRPGTSVNGFQIF